MKNATSDINRYSFDPQKRNAERGIAILLEVLFSKKGEVTKEKVVNRVRELREKCDILLKQGRIDRDRFDRMTGLLVRIEHTVDRLQ